MMQASFAATVIATLFIASFAMGDNDGEAIIGKPQFSVNPDGTFSVTSQGATLEELLSIISKATHVDVHVNEAARKRPVVIDATNITLVQLLRRIAGDNYVMVFDGRDAAALHILPENITTSSVKKRALSEFSGKVKITNQRARMFFMPADNSRNAIDDYIRRRHEALARLSEEAPDKELQAEISFNGYLDAEKVIAFVNNNRLDPVSLNIGWKQNGGGYDLKQNESIEAAVRSAASHHEHFIQQLQEDANMQVSNLRKQGMADAHIQPELTFQQDANDLNSVYREHGVSFYGISVVSRARQLQDALTGKDMGMVRLVDPLWGGSVEKEIGEYYPVTKIAIPLIPDGDGFIQ